MTKRTTGRNLAGAVALGAILTLGGTEGVSAQRAPVFGLEASLGYQILGGDDFDGLDNGLGFEAIGSLAWPAGFEAGVGVGLSSHDVEGSPGDFDLISIFGEGRYRFGVPASETPHVHPFVHGRVGYASLGDENDVAGLLLGAGGGVEYWFTESVAILGAGTFNFLNLEDDVSGTSVGLRAGAKVRFQ